MCRAYFMDLNKEHIQVLIDVTVRGVTGETELELRQVARVRGS